MWQQLFPHLMQQKQLHPHFPLSLYNAMTWHHTITRYRRDDLTWQSSNVIITTKPCSLPTHQRRRNQSSWSGFGTTFFKVKTKFYFCNKQKCQCDFQACQANYTTLQQIEKGYQQRQDYWPPTHKVNCYTHKVYSFVEKQAIELQYYQLPTH